jgi:hypothetical protein
MNPGDRVRKTHPYDGSQRAGKPVGPLLAIVTLREVKPADSGPPAAVADLSDGSWEYPHNLHFEDEAMNRYQITSKQGVDLGTFEADSPV